MLNEENNYACQNSSNEHMCNLVAHVRDCWKQDGGNNIEKILEIPLQVY